MTALTTEAIEKIFDAKLETIETNMKHIKESQMRIEKKTVPTLVCDKRVLQLRYAIASVYVLVAILFGTELLGIKIPFLGG